MTRLAEPANRTARPKAGFLARHLDRARRGVDADLATTVVVVVVAATTMGGLRGAPIATAVVLLALLPAALADLRTHRLPNRWLLAATATGVAAAVVELPVGSRLDDIGVGDIGLGILAAAAPLLVLHLASPASMGFGDVKLGVVLGAALAPLEPIAGLVALAVGGAAGAVAALVTRRRAIPFGPALLTGAAVATVITPSVVTP